MSSFKFLHTADLHLGTPFRGLAVKDPAIADRFAAATRTAFSSLVARALEEKVDFVVIAGDIYDGEWKDNTIGLFFNREIAHLDRAGIPVFLLRGNHDAESVVTRSITLPVSVHEFGTRKPATFRLDALQVALHGQGFAERAATDNLALTYPAPVPGWFNIGVLHTSLTGRPPHAVYAPCSTDDLASRGYDYWALGHVHDFEIVSRDPAVVFPGNIQGRSIRETGPKGGVVVQVEDGQIAAIDRLLVDEARWESATIDVGELASVADVPARVQAALAHLVGEADGRLLALRLTLTGTTDLRREMIAGRTRLADEVQAACHRLHEDIWLEKLDLRLSQPATPARPSTVDAGLDLDALLDAVLAAPEAAEEADRIVAEIAARLPGGLGTADAPLGATTADLLAEARELLMARAMGGR
ncbi:metallophosphoesterase family protein [Amorphus sp. MBR-141]